MSTQVEVTIQPLRTTTTEQNQFLEFMTDILFTQVLETGYFTIDHKTTNSDKTSKITRYIRKFAWEKRARYAFLNFPINWVYASGFQFQQNLIFLRSWDWNLNMLQQQTFISIYKAAQKKSTFKHFHTNLDLQMLTYSLKVLVQFCR